MGKGKRETVIKNDRIVHHFDILQKHLLTIISKWKSTKTRKRVDKNHSYLEQNRIDYLNFQKAFLGILH